MKSWSFFVDVDQGREIRFVCITCDHAFCASYAKAGKTRPQLTDQIQHRNKRWSWNLVCGCFKVMSDARWGGF